MILLLIPDKILEPVVPLPYIVKEVKECSQAGIHGVVGQDLLQKYHAIISFHDNRLYLKFK